MTLDRNLREFVALLNSMGVKCVVVGGHAVAYHGYPRFTGDMDFLVERSPENAARLVSIDIMTSIDGVSFDEAWRGRVETELDGLPMAFLGRSELLKNKRASARPQDTADLSRLEDI